MDIREIVKELETKMWEAINKHDYLLAAYCEGEIIPCGFDSWEEVDFAIAHYHEMIRDFDNSIHNLIRWR